MTELVITNCINRRHRPKRKAHRFSCSICKLEGFIRPRIVTYGAWKPWKEAV